MAGEFGPPPSPPPSPPIPLFKGLSTLEHPIIALSPPPWIKAPLLVSLLTHPLSILAELKPISENLRKFRERSSPF